MFDCVDDLVRFVRFGWPSTISLVVIVVHRNTQTGATAGGKIAWLPKSLLAHPDRYSSTLATAITVNNQRNAVQSSGPIHLNHFLSIANVNRAAVKRG